MGLVFFAATGRYWLPVCNTRHPQPSLASTVREILATALALSVTAALMILLKVVHPPAGATALMVSLGVVTNPLQLPLLEVAVAFLALEAYVVNRLVGIEYPIWTPRVPLSKEGAQLLAERLP